MSRPLDDLFEKSALDPLTFTLGTQALGRLSGPAVGEAVSGQYKVDAPRPGPGPEQRAFEGLFDPHHEAELTRIRTQSMLSEFLSTDPVISSYDHDEVLNAFNQIAHLAPRASTQPAVMRGMLRKMLQQQDAMEPFEASQIVAIEKELKGLEEPAKGLVAPQATKPE